VELRIAPAATDAASQDDEPIGEICVAPTASGPWTGVYTPMLGYWNKPHATAEALRDGIYHSGDLGFLDNDGRLFIRGRRSELILRGGANVYPAEVERILREHPAVADAAVFGIADERLGQRVAAAVILAPDACATPDELREHCRAELARYKAPDDIRVVATLPRNAMGKVLKRDLAATFERDAALALLRAGTASRSA
jgi:acyl-CoA synthetase (AMP-forming)/AMP-acid ligase II